jgi:methylenetetrahydrofolate reductase (NADPH)
MTDAGSELDGVRRLLERPEFEVLPFSSVIDQVGFLPENATLTVTVSPAKGIEPTVRYAVELAGRGFDVTPHLAARSIEDRRQLDTVMTALDEAGITRVFVIGGDAHDAGEFADALSLIHAMEALGRPLPGLGIAAYPDGHAFIPDDVLLQALKDKQPYASYMTTQMCFDPGIISDWVQRVRDDGITLPIHLGMPGVAPITKLAGIAAKIGVGDSVRFLAKHKGLLPALIGRGNYTPDALVSGLESVISDPVADVEALHFYTFNQVESCETWRQDFLASMQG